MASDDHFQLDYQLRTLSNCIEGPERPIAFLIGAGCPCSVMKGGEPLIQDIAGLSKAFAKHAKTWEKPYDDVFNTIWNDLDSTAPNIEQFLTTVRLRNQVAKSSKKPSIPSKSLTKLDELACAFVRGAMAVRLSEVGTSDTGYHELARWINAIDREHPVQLFTTNYDLLLEQALETTRLPYFDGFVGADEAFFDPFAIDEEEPRLPKRWVRLWKLHGSINWWLDPEPGGARVFRSALEHPFPNMIYPSHLKYDQARQMPFLIMFERLRKHLQKRSSILICIGFSFFDEHIWAAIAQALSASPQATLFALQFKKLAESEDATRLAKLCHNVTVVCPDGVVTGGTSHAWLAPADKLTFPGLTNVGNFAEFGTFLGLASGSSTVKSATVDGSGV